MSLPAVELLAAQSRKCSGKEEMKVASLRIQQDIFRVSKEKGIKIIARAAAAPEGVNAHLSATAVNLVRCAQDK